MSKKIDMMEVLRERYASYRGAVETLYTSDRVLPQAARTVASESNRITASLRAIERRANQLLAIALDVAGMDEYIGKWRIQIDSDPARLIEEAINDGNVRFILCYEHDSRWRGNILKCPLLRIMRMSFPVKWLHQSRTQTLQEMQFLMKCDNVEVTA